jgi:hypothetical protein
VISDNINLDKLLSDIDQQIEILMAIAGDSAVLIEQLRILSEARDMLLSQEMELHRLAELIDPEMLEDHSTLAERNQGNSGFD